MVTFGLAESEFLQNEIENFCLKNLKSKSHFGFKCEVYKFLHRTELDETRSKINRILDPKILNVFLEVVQNE